jgi:hypothetical protein
LGAGLGAMTWGLVRALEACGARGRVEALLADEDPAALRTAEVIARAAKEGLGPSTVELAIWTDARDIDAVAHDRSLPRADVIIVGQVLSELAPHADAAERLEAQASLVEHLLDARLASDGALVVIEPALRDRTRHLHALRDRLLASSARPVTVFAPCLHARPCPLLATEGEWCHEDLAAVDLPSWVVPLARAAGLRFQGLTFSYLVLRTDGRSMTAPAPSGAIRFRAVSDLLRSKGKAELWTCGEDGERRRLRRLSRDAGTERGVTFESIGRGDIVTLCGEAGSAVDDRGRIEANVVIDVGPSGH